MIEASARKTKQGPLVREGLMIESVTFRYDVERYGKDVNELSKTAQFVAPVVVARRRILRTRVRFDCPWSVVGVADVDPEQVDRHKLTAWLATGGRRVGLGDWRPEKSGHYGRFDVKKVIELPDAPGGPGLAGRGLAWLGAAWRGEAGNVSRHVAASRRQFRRTAPRDLPV